jgi:nucleoside-diphosphate-sugar epimerase
MILVTGATGFIGSSLIPFFEQKGIGTIGVSRSYSRSVNSYFNPQILNDDAISGVIHLAGKAHDVKNLVNLQEYYDVNTHLTIKLFDAFLESSARIFIYLSSIKALCDSSSEPLTEDMIPSPQTPYGDSKLKAEVWLLSKIIPPGKKLIILRPVIVHGPANMGNLRLLFKFISLKIPWPLGVFENMRSFCSIDNLLFVFKELIERDDIPSGVYNIADDEPLSTNELIKLIAQNQGKKVKIWHLSKSLISLVAKLGDILHLPLNTERLQKLTSSYVVSNAKIKAAIGKPLPVSTREGLLKTFKSFNS